MTKNNVFDIRTGRVLANAVPARRVTPAALLTVGTTVENGTLRVHRYRDVLVLWDLTHAGKRGKRVTKRGKRVTKLSVTVSYALNAAAQDNTLELLSAMIQGLRSFGVAASALGEYAMTHPHTLNLTSTEERGVDVKPAGVQKLMIDTAKLNLEADPLDFTVRCKLDQHNGPTLTAPVKASRTAAAAFYRWASQNQDRIKAMSYREVLQELMQLGIRFHDYCAVD